MLSLTFICSLLISINTVFGIDRTQFSNARATERHDGYLSFSTELEFPLSLKWSNLNASCAIYYAFINFALTNEIFYCLTNEISGWYRSTDSYLEAYNINNGDLLFKTYIDINITKKINETGFDGVVTIPPNDIAIIDDTNGDLFILNGTNGNIIYNISIDDECKKRVDIECLDLGSLMVSSLKYKSVFIHYATSYSFSKYTAYLFQFDIENNITNTMTLTEDILGNPQIPAICNDDFVITTNEFGNASAFQINENNGQLINIWNYSMPSAHTIYYNPPLCIPTNDGGFNVLICSNTFADTTSWVLLNGMTGGLIKELKWNRDQTGIPVINTDKMIMITTSIIPNNIIAYNISSSDNGNWAELYNINYGDNSDLYLDLMIINENIFLCSKTVVDVYSIINGKKIFSWSIPNSDMVEKTGLAAGVDENGKPIIIVVATLDEMPPQKTFLYALQ